MIQQRMQKHTTYERQQTVLRKCHTMFVYIAIAIESKLRKQ